MGGLFISLLTLALVLISAFIVLLVLMQRTSNSGGMGGALGGGAAEQAFGAETTTILTRGTIYSVIAFFVVSLALYLIYQSQLEPAGAEVKAEELAGSPEGGGAASEGESSGEGQEPFVPGGADGEATDGDANGSMAPPEGTSSGGGESEATPGTDPKGTNTSASGGGATSSTQ